MSARKCGNCGSFYSMKLSACPDCGTSYNVQKLPTQSATASAMHLQDAPRVAPPHPCIAHDCPLPGTWNPIIYGDGHPWYCFVHSELPATDWARATRAIRDTLGEVGHLETLPFRRAIRAAVAQAIKPL